MAGPTHTQDLFAYDAWPSGEPYDWSPAGRGESPWDNYDFHVDLGCGTKKKGRIGVDRFVAPGVNVLCDLDGWDFGLGVQTWNHGLGSMPGVHRGPVTCALPASPGEDAQLPTAGAPWRGLPFADSSIESIISHHAFEHIGEGFIALMDECYRVLKPDGLLRVITPLFPSWSAVSDPDHTRYFMASGDACTFDSFCGEPREGGCWLESFSVPYSSARFKRVDLDYTPELPPAAAWTPEDARELRVALTAVK